MNYFPYLCNKLSENSRFMLYRYLRRYPFSSFLIVCIVLLSLLPIPDVKMAEDIPLVDKWTHMVMYGVLTLAVWFETLRAGVLLSAWRVGLRFLLPVMMGGLLELAQAYLTTCRSGEWLDFVANTIGVCIGTAVGFAWYLLRKRNKGARGE